MDGIGSGFARLAFATVISTAEAARPRPCNDRGSRPDRPRGSEPAAAVRTGPETRPRGDSLPGVVDLSVFDEQLRESFADLLIEGEQVERIGPPICISGAARGGFVGYRDLAGVEGAELDALIERCIALYAERRERFEWKLYGHDRPPELADRLEAAGFVPEERETVEIALAASIAGDPELPAELAFARSANAQTSTGSRASKGRSGALTATGLPTCLRANWPPLPTRSRSPWSSPARRSSVRAG